MLTKNLRGIKLLAKLVIKEILFLSSLVNCEIDTDTELELPTCQNVVSTLTALEQRVGKINALYKTLVRL